MNTLTALTGFALVLTACAMPFDLLGEPLFTNPTLITMCQPVDAPVNGRVYCEYNPTNMTCTASCENGFVADSSIMFRTLTCTYEMPFPTVNAFGACRMAVPTLAPTLQPTFTDSPVVGPVVHAGRCIHNVMECGTEEGDFQACMDCSKYVTCSVNGATLRDCPVGLQWDDTVKRCERRSSTCM
ncbi:uncharacterized protein LOC110459489 [Mizuhopecten yessoensis]|uniref:Chitin-binding type-2 domain-containing protein n=1 Tax=Mizuhopecten yessoensis TaxID=6573 RepID=A0A210Q4H4_MIZYE|nr:uncharacterized protein LOC110459489 [Mizuhopecten yessoensis]OWF43625.1 hypothetical protein KP79_PYT22323 [Mizuhopecten yessoensis]